MKWKVYLAGHRGLVMGKVNLINESATLALRKRRVSPAPQCCYSALDAERVVPVCRNNVWDPRQQVIFSEINSRSYLPNSSSDSKESGSSIPESICSDPQESGGSGPKACFLGGETMLILKSSASIFIAVTDSW
jgi:hypothetical protein